MCQKDKAKAEKKKRRRHKRGMRPIPYDYEAAYNKALEDMHEWLAAQMFKVIRTTYALKEIRAGEQMEIEIYPQFFRREDIPAEGLPKKNNKEAQRCLNDKNARKKVERLINANFGDNDLWCTFTYDDAHAPEDGDIDAAIKNVQRFIGRLNYHRKKRGLPNVKYIYVTEYDPHAKIRWHHHMVMDGLLDRDMVESLWKNGSRSQIRRLEKDENGLSGMANYIVKNKNRIPYEKRWNSSKGLKKPEEKVIHNKQPKKGVGSYKKIQSYVDKMVKQQDSIKEQMEGWYPDYIFTNANVYYNDFNARFYIHARLRRREGENRNAIRKKE